MMSPYDGCRCKPRHLKAAQFNNLEDLNKFLYGFLTQDIYDVRTISPSGDTDNLMYLVLYYVYAY